jgi:hypothetical protein
MDWSDRSDRRLPSQSRTSNVRAIDPGQNIGSDNKPGPQVSIEPANPPINVSALNRGGTRPYLAKSAGGTKFTDEEIQSLFEEGADILNLDEDQTINAWIAWAVEASFRKMYLGYAIC